MRDLAALYKLNSVATDNFNVSRSCRSPDDASCCVIGSPQDPGLYSPNGHFVRFEVAGLELAFCGNFCPEYQK